MSFEIEKLRNNVETKIRFYKNIKRSVAIFKKKKSLIEMPFDTSTRFQSMLVERTKVPICKEKWSNTNCIKPVTSLMVQLMRFELTSLIKNYSLNVARLPVPSQLQKLKITKLLFLDIINKFILILS